MGHAGPVRARCAPPFSGLRASRPSRDAVSAVPPINTPGTMAKDYWRFNPQTIYGSPLYPSADGVQFRGTKRLSHNDREKARGKSGEIAISGENEKIAVKKRNENGVSPQCD
jgi:hypothetical protein